MNEEYDPGEEDLTAWQPPELLERARIIAERDAATAQKIADGTNKPKKLKGRREPKEPMTPPEARNPRFALTAALLGLLLTLAVQAAEQPRAGLVYALNWCSAAFSALVYLKFILPVGQKLHKLLLGLLLAGSVGLGFAAAVFSAFTEDSAPSRRLIGLGAAALALALSPMFWLLCGLLRRRSAEKQAGLIQLALLALLILTAGLNALARAITKSAAEPIITLPRVLSFFQGVCLLLLLMNWPVLGKPILSPLPEKSEKKDNHGNSA